MLKKLKKARIQLKYDLHIQRSFNDTSIVFSCGMGRSGSTLLFNILRMLLMEKYKNEFSAIWIGDHMDIKPEECVLIKTHIMTSRRYAMADNVFFSYRDIRDCLVSWHNKNNKEPSIALAKKWLLQFQKAKRSNAQMISYETLTQQTKCLILDIATMLDITVDVEKIFYQIPDSAPNLRERDKFSKESLLHKNHFTGTQPGDWQTILSKKLVKFLKDECDWFFLETGYTW